MRPSHRYVVVFLVLLASSCTDSGMGPNDAWLADHSDIADPAKRWQAYGVQNYSMLQKRTCFCSNGGKNFLITVRSGRMASVVDPTDGTVFALDRWGEFKTIDELFDLVKSIDTTKVARLRVSYDVRYGYPLNVFVDPSAGIVDEEYGYGTEIVKP